MKAIIHGKDALVERILGMGPNVDLQSQVSARGGGGGGGREELEHKYLKNIFRGVKQYLAVISGENVFWPVLA